MFDMFVHHIVIERYSHFCMNEPKFLETFQKIEPLELI